MISSLAGNLQSMKFGPGQTYKNVFILPLLGTSDSRFDYITLGEAMETRLLTITELTQGGSVPELKVLNNGDRPILLLDGEELAGAKQNRVLNTSVLIPGRQTIIIPVSCTEQGRWNYVSENFSASGNVMAHTARSRKVRSVSHSLESSASFCSDQGEVWNSIAEMHEASGVVSPTMAMRDVYDTKKSTIDDAIKTFGIIEGQTGLLAVIDGKVAGLDMLSSPAAYARLHQKLVTSYAIEAVLTGKPKTIPSADDATRKASEFILALPGCEEQQFKSVGLGNDYRYKANHIAGSALVHEDCVLHTAFFSVEEDSTDVKMSNLRRRREYRLE